MVPGAHDSRQGARCGAHSGATGESALPTGARGFSTTAWYTALALTVATLALRLWHVKHGLPDFLEEAIPFKQAFEMWGWKTGHTDLNPDFFNYPTLSLYLHFAVQKLQYLFGQLAGYYTSPSDYWLLYQLDPTAPVVVARLVGISCDLATVLAVWTIGERLRRGAGLLAALLIAFSPTLILTGRSIYADSVMAALVMWSIERMLAYLQRGGRWRLAVVVLLVGCAAGAKYTAGLLVLPLAWVLWARHGWRGLCWWPAAAAGCLLVFCLTSPYTVLEFSRFWHDFSFERRHMAEGHLGTLDRRGGLFHLRTLAGDQGWPALFVLLGSLVATLRQLIRGQRPSTVVLWLFLLPNALSIAWFRMEATRYLLPVLPGAALLVATSGLHLAGQVTGRKRRWAVAALAAILLVPPGWAGLQAAAQGGDSTRCQARRWCEENLADGALIVQEHYGAVLRNSIDVEVVRGHPTFGAARAEIQRRWLEAPRYRSVIMPMAVSGRYTMKVQPQTGGPVQLNVFDHASDINRVFYSPTLYRGVDYFLASSAVRQRYERDAARYREQLAFYGLLDREAELAAHFPAGADVPGPEITIYRLGERLQELLAREFSGFGPYWWAHSVPRRFRDRLDALLAPADRLSDGAVRLADGKPAIWVRSLRRPFETYIVPFLAPMAHYLVESGHFREARRHAAAVLAMIPDEPILCLIFSTCCRRMGDWGRARQAVDNTLSMLVRKGRDEPGLRLEFARLLHHFGEIDAERAELERVVAITQPGSQMARQAQRLLGRLATGEQ